MASQLTYERSELLAEHPYVAPHKEAGYLLHGGFLADGSYASPRTLNRVPAVAAWAEELRTQGGAAIDVSIGILPEPRFPNLEQSRLLLAHRFDRTFWNSMTTTGILEARGGMLCRLTAPDFQDLVEEDISGTTLGHLNNGLLWAHGADEAGDPGDPERGGHDRLWFAVRDMVFAKGSHPVQEPPRTSGGAERVRGMPLVPLAHEIIIRLLMGVLVVEVRAETFFSQCVALLRDESLFTDRRTEAEHAAVIVERIRQDEQIHIDYLRGVISELRWLNFKTPQGPVRGEVFIDPVWDQARSEFKLAPREAVSAGILQDMTQRLGARAGGVLFERFEALEV